MAKEKQEKQEKQETQNPQTDYVRMRDKELKDREKSSK